MGRGKRIYSRTGGVLYVSACVPGQQSSSGIFSNFSPVHFSETGSLILGLKFKHWPAPRIHPFLPFFLSLNPIRGSPQFRCLCGSHLHSPKTYPLLLKRLNRLKKELSLGVMAHAVNSGRLNPERTVVSVSSRPGWGVCIPSLLSHPRRTAKIIYVETQSQTKQKQEKGNYYLYLSCCEIYMKCSFECFFFLVL